MKIIFRRLLVPHSSPIVPALLAGLLFIAPVLMQGCAQKNTGTVIEFWTLQLSPTYDTYFQSLIKKFEEARPGVKVRWVDIPYDAAIQKLLAAVAAGQAPDVVNLSTDFLSRFVRLGAFADMQRLLPADSLAIFYPNALSSCTVEGNLVALPWYLNTYVLFYNKELLKTAGMTEQDVPQTFPALTRFIKTYKDRTGKFALFWNIGKDSYLPLMLESEGVAMTDESMTRATFDTERGIALIDEWVQLYRKGYLPRESIISRGTSIIEPYQSGQVAMVLTGPVFLERVQKNAPAVYATTGIAPSPVGASGKQELATMALSVLASSKFPQIAADFVMFVLSAENQTAFSKITTTYPSVKRALDDPFFSDDDGMLETKARIVGASGLPHAGQLSAYKSHPEYVRLNEVFGEAVQNACLGKISTQEALHAAAIAWNDILAGPVQ